MEKEGKHMHGLFGSDDTHVAKGGETPDYKKRYELANEEADMTQRTSEWATFFMNQAKNLKPGLITRFFICIQDHFLEQHKRAASLNASNMNITAYCEYQTMFNGAQRYHLRALSEMRAFLSHVKSGRDGHNPNTYPSFLERITVADEAASKCFSNLIDKYPKSLPVVRLYARFVTTVKSDPELAKKLTVLARQLCGDNDEPAPVKTILPQSAVNNTGKTTGRESSVAAPVSLQLQLTRRPSRMSHTNLHAASLAVGPEQQDAIQEWVGGSQPPYDSKPVLEADEDADVGPDGNKLAITSNSQINLDQEKRPALRSS
ncbi:hypothetical protein HK102_010307, partial [Quaeritorhiza haematococci]